MEIASPLPFNSYSRVAKKRTFACSPSFVDSHGLSIQPSAPHEELMSDHTSYPMESENSPFITSQQVFKRRRFDSNEAVGPTVYSTPFSSPFGQSHSPPSAAVSTYPILFFYWSAFSVLKVLTIFNFILFVFLNFVYLILCSFFWEKIPWGQGWSSC